jgi:hypothetical protein
MLDDGRVDNPLVLRSSVFCRRRCLTDQLFQNRIDDGVVPCRRLAMVVERSGA